MEKICAGIVTYNPEIELLIKNLNLIKRQVEKIYIFDNGSSNLENIKEIDKDIEVISVGKNVGIAKALNNIMQHASDEEYEWVLSMDQDTLLGENVIKKYSEYLNDESVGILTLKVIRKSSEQKIIYETPSNNLVDSVQRCPTSGMLLKTSLWEAAGKYDEWMFIDYVDYDMCQKILLLDKKILRINEAYMIQNLGDTKEGSLLGKAFSRSKSLTLNRWARTFNHNPNRNYYYMRNSIYFIRKYKNHIKVKQEVKKIFSWELKKLLFEKQKLSQFLVIIKGIKDGIMVKI
ncbi:glycosyltransferase [Enterococcus caccae]|uniref:Glycosyltransferase 2-like domain-containing protein n=1 Tax=Enterococcus caccae ATCC BAA-1240 TaxID=1158612 RepID=R3U7I2_9ENTE|nr:glycosyltransferase [Enterococcus caccae]EOL49393.1 hypothetical protein UC7_00770 [Enterococcus caccae ATCC BAA-1240]EOT56445.1 hypothetical protein I580_03245 [Enterococcus caccae ATCC BAA-1240]